MLYLLSPSNRLEIVIVTDTRTCDTLTHCGARDTDKEPSAGKGAQVKSDSMIGRQPKILRAVELFHILLLVSMFVLAAIAWRSVPDVLPVHWTGLPPAIPMHPDGYGGKAFALLPWPLITAGFYLLLMTAPKWSDNYEGRESSVAFALLRLCATAFFASLYFATVASYEGYAVNLEAVDRNATLAFSSILVGGFIWQLIREHL